MCNTMTNKQINLITIISRMILIYNHYKSEQKKKLIVALTLSIQNIPQFINNS